MTTIRFLSVLGVLYLPLLVPTAPVAAQSNEDARAWMQWCRDLGGVLEMRGPTLTCGEQRQIDTATDEAVLVGRVGATVNWESATRPGVRGSSTVTAVETGTAEGDCMTVTDIIIVNGDETRAPKRMCRRPPSNRYVRV